MLNQIVATRRRLAARTSIIVQSEIRAMSIECEKVGGVNLSQGVCDTEVPDAVVRGAIEGMREGVNSYTRYDGLAILRQAIAAKARRDNGLDVDPEREIIVSAGTTGAFYCACLALLEPGDEVILFEPYYGYHVQTLLAAGAVPSYVMMSPPDWRFSLEALEAAVKPRTRGIMINTPANPSGKVFSREELEMLAAFAQAHDLFVFTDEIYEYFLYDGRTHICPATLPGMRDRTITIAGFSKTYSITGWRIGYAICGAQWSEAIGFFNDLVYVCAPAPLQVGVARGLEQLGPDYYAGLTVEYTAKRDRICQALDDAGLTPYRPQGAYYVLADISRIPGTTSKERAMTLLHRTGIAAVPGEAFFNGSAGDTIARFCYAKTDAELEDACHRLERIG